MVSRQPAPTTAQAQEVAQGERFEFGKNWRSFLRTLDEDRIREAEASLKAMLELADLRGMSFLDIGSGSGLFSLAAARLGARKVHSFDFDPESVACTRELKRRYFPDWPGWAIEGGSVLDRAFLARLGQFDVVYAWGVLHHTGDLWQALDIVAPLVGPRGRLFLAIYNDQGRISRRWKVLKVLYNRGWIWKVLIASVFIPLFITRGFAGDVLRRQNPSRRYREYKKKRGMSIVHDWFDWLGGLPFEYAKPEEIFEFYKKRGFALAKLRTSSGSHGNNEFVFMRCAD